ncbi:hypothetical protein ACQ3I4_13330 [Zafaria sp. Z1313]|uniref:hypothetical protein n=1 Tax=unclassified Zafaria TaxID=2828765 RepID=UPI002E76E75B|nr:hypothetical protein [Zafaria sp. J156]MEE1621444.1 hypothetical protein [Zafaria sp. J156]
MKYELDVGGMRTLLNTLDTTVLDLPQDVVALEDAVAALKGALGGSRGAARTERLGEDVLGPDGLAVVVRCENAAAAGRGVLDAVVDGDERMADDARAKAS